MNTPTQNTTTTSADDRSRSTRVAVEYTDGAPLAPDDPRVGAARAIQAARAVVARLDADHTEAATPCPDWSALDMANHLVAVVDRAAAGPSGADLDGMPLLAPFTADEVAAALGRSAEVLHRAWSDPAALEQPITVPWGTFPGAIVIETYATEILVHAWDLAVSLGLDVDWPESDASAYLPGLQMGLPAEGRGPEMPFDPVVVPDESAPPMHHLVGWMGRDPATWT